MLSLAAIVPHGDEILLPEDSESKKLHDAMKALAKKVISKNIDEYIFITPHHLRIDTHFGILLTEYLEGSWKYKNLKFRRTLKCDKQLAQKLYELSIKNELPVVGVNFGALEGKLSRICLDWGTLIPLYFLPKRKIVLITPARGVKKQYLIKLGEIIENLANTSNKNIAVIVSADHAHAHDKDGPYGYHPDAKYYDDFIFKHLNSLEYITELNGEIIDNAKPDSYWQLLILYGVLKNSPLKLKKKVYGLPSYFGMIVAWYE